MDKPDGEWHHHGENGECKAQHHRVEHGGGHLLVSSSWRWGQNPVADDSYGAEQPTHGQRQIRPRTWTPIPAPPWSAHRRAGHSPSQTRRSPRQGQRGQGSPPHPARGDGWRAPAVETSTLTIALAKGGGMARNTIQMRLKRMSTSVHSAGCSSTKRIRIWNMPSDGRWPASGRPLPWLRRWSTAQIEEKFFMKKSPLAQCQRAVIAMICARTRDSHAITSRRGSCRAWPCRTAFQTGIHWGQDAATNLALSGLSTTVMPLARRSATPCRLRPTGAVGLGAFPWRRR